MEFGSTTAVDFASRKTTRFGQIRMHLRHEEKVNHKNKNIDFSLTKYNSTKAIDNTPEGRKEWNRIKKTIHKLHNEFFKDLVEEHDKKQVKESRKYKTVSNYLKGKKYEREMLAQFGSEDSNIELREKLNLSKEEYAQISNNALTKYVKSFIERNGKYFKVGAIANNVDEKLPHTHMQVFPMAYNEKGKPTYSLNAAVKCTLEDNGIDTKGKSHQQNMVTFRGVEDDIIANCFDEAFKEKGIDVDIKLVRKHSKITGLPHEARIALNKARKELKQKKKTLDVREQKLNTREQRLNAKEYSLDEREKGIKRNEENLKADLGIIKKNDEITRDFFNENAQRCEKLNEFGKQIIERERRVGIKEKSLDLTKMAEELNKSQREYDQFYNNSVQPAISAIKKKRKEKDDDFDMGF